MDSDCEQVWELFSRLGDISYTEIYSYSALTGEILEQWEIDAIIALNSLRRAQLEWKPNG